MLTLTNLEQSHKHKWHCRLTQKWCIGVGWSNPSFLCSSVHFLPYALTSRVYEQDHGCIWMCCWWACVCEGKININTYNSRAKVRHVDGPFRSFRRFVLPHRKSKAFWHPEKNETVFCLISLISSLQLPHPYSLFSHFGFPWCWKLLSVPFFPTTHYPPPPHFPSFCMPVSLQVWLLITATKLLSLLFLLWAFEVIFFLSLFHW